VKCECLKAGESVHTQAPASVFVYVEVWKGSGGDGVWWSICAALRVWICCVCSPQCLVCVYALGMWPVSDSSLR
jgi:hypothetical protein